MKSWVLAASLLAAAISPVAQAADIDDNGPPPPPRSGAYDDPRFADIYKYPKAPSRPFNTAPPGYHDEDDDDNGPPRPPSRYSRVPPSPYGYGPPHGQTCVRSEQVRDRLTSMGWRDFHDGQPQGDLVTLRARRPSGRLFELTLHRCSGQIAEVRALEPRRFGPFAYHLPRHDGQYGYDDERSWRERPYAWGGPRRWWNWNH